jgi:hypothetical protein
MHSRPASPFSQEALLAICYTPRNNQCFRSSVVIQPSGCLFQVLLWMPSSLYICFQNTELAFYIGVICFLSVINRHLFKFGIITSLYSIQNACRTCSPLLHEAWHFNGITNLEHSQIRTNTATVCSVLFRLRMPIWQCRPWFDLAWLGLRLHMKVWDDLAYFSTKLKKKTHTAFQ